MEENNHIIVNFQPFTAKQEILVYINGNCEKQIYVSVDRIVDSVKGLKSTYNINRIDLCGNRDYLSFFREKMLDDYDNCIITIYNK